MSADKSKMILKNTEKAGKTHTFNDKHNPRTPAQYWLQETTDGPTLFVVLYTLACKWSKCLGCNLPSQVSSKYVNYKDLIKQIDFVFHNILSEAEKMGLKKLIVSNNGSVFDEDTFPTNSLMYLITQSNIHTPNLETITLETRPEYVDWDEVTIIKKMMKEIGHKTEVEIAVGFEAFDDTIRNEHFGKGLELVKFEAMVKKVAENNMSLKTYFMHKPVPGMSEEDAIKDISDAIRYLDDISHQYGININMHLNPTYVAKGTLLEKAYLNGEYSPPLLENVVKAVLSAEDSNISVFVGLDDEGLAVPEGNCLREGTEELQEKIHKFNKTGDFRYLK